MTVPLIIELQARLVPDIMTGSSMVLNYKYYEYFLVTPKKSNFNSTLILRKLYIFFMYNKFMEM